MPGRVEELQMDAEACNAQLATFETLSHLKTVIPICGDIDTLKKQLLADILNSLEKRIQRLLVWKRENL